MKKTWIVGLFILCLGLVSCGKSKFTDDASAPGGLGRPPSAFVDVPSPCTGSNQGTITGVWKLAQKMNNISHEYTLTISDKSTQYQTTCFYGGQPVTVTVTSASQFDNQRYTIETSNTQSVATGNRNMPCVASLAKGTHTYTVAGNCLKINDGKIRTFHR